jgi:hypothetical protein
MMQHLRIFLLLAFFPQFLLAQNAPTLVWSPAQAVANGAVYDNIRPQVTLAENGRPLVIWCRTAGGRHGYVARWNGSSFDTPFKINPTGSVNAYTVEGPNIVARGDTAYLVYVTYPTASAKVMVRSSFDGGINWNGPVWVDSLGADLPTFGNVEILDGGMPMVTYIHQTSTYGNPRWVVRKSNDAGQSWQPEVVTSGAAQGNLVCDCCVGHTYWHEGKVIALFRNNDANLRDFWATVSVDGGQSFPVAYDLDSTDWTLAACPSSGAAALMAGDSIYTTFMSQGANGLARVWLGASSLGTGQLAYNLMLNGNVANGTSQNYPAIAGNGDTLIAVWMESTSGNPEIMLRYSFTGMAGLWANPLVNVSALAGTQSFPDIAWQNGRVHVVWQDDASNQVMYRTAIVGEATSVLAPNAYDWSIYPNPTQGMIRLRGLPTSDCRVELFDAKGHPFFVHSLSGSVGEIDLTELASGTYYLRVTQGERSLGTKRVVLID